MKNQQLILSLFVLAIAAIAYLVWLHNGEIMELEAELDRLRAGVERKRGIEDVSFEETMRGS